MRFKLGELFCGPGGMAIAAHTTEPVHGPNGEYSIEHTWGVDFSKPAIDTFKANLGEDNGIQMDARTFVEEGLTKERKINALAFGFPCNSFSAAGAQEGLKSEKFGSLYKCGVAVLEAYQPKWFVAENVSGIRACDAGKQFRKILDSFAHAGKHGYDVTAHLYKFEAYGVPQMRHRYVIVGIRHDIAKRYKLKFRVPAPVCGPGRRNFVTVREALATVTNQTEWGGEITRQSEDVVWRLRFTPPGENAWKLDEIVEYDDVQLMEYLKKLPWFNERIAPLGSVEKIREKIDAVRLKCTKARMSMIYRRLDPNFPSYTITGSGGGGTHVYHWEEDRALTNEERAALQTFPRNFEFKGSKEEVRKQIGMAVPTLGAKIVFQAILNTFAGKDYPFIEDDSDIYIEPTNEYGSREERNMSINRTRISEKTIKVLFARSQNCCAFPGCHEEIVDSTTGVVYGEMCHIEGVETGAARYNPNLNKEAVNSESNLILLCHKHHKLIDTKAQEYNVAWLKEIKRKHEIQGLVEINPSDAQSARLMLAEMVDTVPYRTYNNSSHFEAGDNAVQNITINNKIIGRGKKSIPSVPSSGTIGSDSPKRAYVKHLYDRLIEFKSKIPNYNTFKAGSIVARNVTKLFGATWTNVPLSRYDGFISYLQAEIDKTPIGRMNKVKGVKNYSTYDEFNQK